MKVNKRQLKELIKFLKVEWRDLKGIVIIGFDKDGTMHSTQKGLNLIEIVGLANWFKLSVEDDIRERSWRQMEEDRPQNSLV